MNNMLTIIIPVFNEINTIEQIINQTNDISFIKKDTILARGITIPISPNTKLLFIAERYCIIDAVPNLK